MPSLEKARTVHNYLISTSKYDERKLVPKESYTPYALLFDHCAVCKAYAETNMIFMYLLVIECYMVVGKMRDSSETDAGHAWNIIKIGDKYGHVDVTSDNPDPKHFGKPIEKYFFANDTFMTLTHTGITHIILFVNQR